jgi:hypothetical protein
MKIKSLLLCLLFPSLVSAQSMIHDGMLWTGFRIKRSWNRQWESHVHLEHRWNENVGQSQKGYIQFGSSYTPLQGISLNLAYRMEERFRPTQEQYHTRHRLQAGVTFSRKFKRFEFSLRSHGQVRYDTRPDQNIPWRFHLRERFRMAYKWPQLPLKTDLSYEAWFPLNGTAETPISRHRFSVAQDWEIMKGQTLTLGLLYQINTAFAARDRDIGLLVRYTFDWKPVKRK